MSSDGSAYTGRDNLEVMTDAVNYNNFLMDVVLAQVGGVTCRVLDFGAGSGTYADMLLRRGVVAAIPGAPAGHLAGAPAGETSRVLDRAVGHGGLLGGRLGGRAEP